MILSYPSILFLSEDMCGEKLVILRSRKVRTKELMFK
jgi:hypothetical protein